jgi:hypothetical protein
MLLKFNFLPSICPIGMLVRSFRLQLRNIDLLRVDLAPGIGRESNIFSSKYFRG